MVRNLNVRIKARSIIVRFFICKYNTNLSYAKKWRGSGSPPSRCQCLSVKWRSIMILQLSAWFFFCFNKSHFLWQKWIHLSLYFTYRSVSEKDAELDEASANQRLDILNVRYLLVNLILKFSQVDFHSFFLNPLNCYELKSCL